MSEKSVFPFFRSRGFVFNGSDISRFWFIKTWGRKIAIGYIFCCAYQYIVEILSSKFKKKTFLPCFEHFLAIFFSAIGTGLVSRRSLGTT